MAQTPAISAMLRRRLSTAIAKPLESDDKHLPCKLSHQHRFVTSNFDLPIRSSGIGHQDWASGCALRRCCKPVGL